MSLSWKSENEVKINYKARLEHKLYLARENPEPTFDISECALKSVPSGIYLLCKVFRKEALYMQYNRLNSLSGGGALSDLSLITILNLSNNNLYSLPSDIRHLISLKELYLQNNNIRKLPNEVGNLTKLNTLDVSKNLLNCLPDTIGFLRNLITFNISDNKSMKKLPKSLGYAQKLEILGIDNMNLSYPPIDIIRRGHNEIIAFLAKECGIEYFPDKCTTEISLTNEESCNNSLIQSQTKENDVQAVLAKLEKMKEQRQTALLQVENNIKEQQEVELKLQNKLKIHKQKLLEDLVVQQQELEDELKKVQLEQGVNRKRLLSFIYNAEKEADNVIKQFLHNSEEERQTQSMLIEKEKLENIQFLSRCKSEQHIIEKRDTLEAMEKLLEDEFKKKKFVEYTKSRDDTVQSLLSLEVKNNEHLAHVIQEQERNRQELLNRLGEDEKLQKAAVSALLERSDARSWSIVQQVNLVQSQLAALTNIELERRKFEINQQLIDIADKRITLSAILMNLLEQQELRRSQLLETIQHIEEQNMNNSTNNNSFWLHQYQSLMEARPQGLLETLEPNLVRHVAIAGALHCLPFLSTLPSMIDNFCMEDLKSIGINNANDREAIRMAVENFLSEKKFNSNESMNYPTALEEEASSSHKIATAPAEELLTYNTTECVVCMNAQCEIIFLSCGHICCCETCADVISSECPLCRSTIERKIKFMVS